MAADNLRGYERSGKFAKPTALLSRKLEIRTDRYLSFIWRTSFMLRASLGRALALGLTLVLLTLLPLPALAQNGSDRAALMTMVEAERAFAATSVQKGLRASFLQYFAPNCIGFYPEPANAPQRLRSRPAPAVLPATVLNWYPVYADISQAGDMGYTTGPATFTDNRKQPATTSYNYYFSVWKKQKDGSWKVVMDIGIETPDASNVSPVEFRAAPEIRLKLKDDYNPADGWAQIIKAEGDFSKLASSKGLKVAYMKYRADDLRLHRDGRFPLVGTAIESSDIFAQPVFASSKSIFSEVSKSGDLGYSYGSYEAKNAAGAVIQKGFYARVWRRDASGTWKLAADIANKA
jgi:ketosteroid isomerase-like protein